MAEPREPDRFEAKAREVWRSCLHDGDSPSHEPIANALRREHDAALDEAAREAEALSSNYDKDRAEIADSIADAIRALASPAAAPAAETCPEPPPGWETITTGPTAGCGNIATYRDPAPPPRAEAPDPERDRNRHNAMLVEAWRGEFGALCKALFPGHTGMIGWKHIHAKIADREALLRECEEALELEGYGSDPDGLIARIRAARTSKPGAVEGKT